MININIDADSSTWAADLQQLIYSTMNQLIFQDDDGEYRIGFPHDDEPEHMTALTDLIQFATASQSNASLVLIMLVNSLSYWFTEAMRERAPGEDPRLHLANLSVELLTKGFGQNAFGDQ